VLLIERTPVKLYVLPAIPFAPHPTGSLPATWSRLGALRDLRLTECSLSGPLPPAWGALTKLKVCWLWNNTLSGPLPGAWSGMAALEELGLSNNNVTGGGHWNSRVDFLAWLRNKHCMRKAMHHATRRSSCSGAMSMCGLCTKQT
jgi:hypothetical protein